MSSRIDDSVVSQPYDPQASIASVRIRTALLRNWRRIAFTGVIIGAAVGLVAASQERVYTASASFMLHAADGRSMTAASSIARQFGIDVGGDQINDSPQLYADLIRSRTLLRRIVEQQYEVQTEHGEMATRSLVEQLTDGRGRNGRPSWHEAVEAVRNSLTVSVARETGVVTIEVTDANPFFAEELARRLMAAVNDFNLETRQARAQAESRFVEQRLNEARESLTERERELQSFLRDNRSFGNSPDLAFQHERLQRQLAISQEFVVSLAHGLEQARLSSMRDLPVIRMIDDPDESARPVPRRVIFRTILALLLGVVAVATISIAAELTSKEILTETESEREFERARRDFANDVRAVARIVGFRRRSP